MGSNLVLVFQLNGKPHLKVDPGEKKSYISFLKAKKKKKSRIYINVMSNKEF